MLWSAETKQLHKCQPPRHQEICTDLVQICEKDGIWYQNYALWLILESPNQENPCQNKKVDSCVHEIVQLQAKLKSPMGNKASTWSCPVKFKLFETTSNFDPIYVVNVCTSVACCLFSLLSNQSFSLVIPYLSNFSCSLHTGTGSFWLALTRRISIDYIHVSWIFCWMMTYTI